MVPNRITKLRDTGYLKGIWMTAFDVKIDRSYILKGVMWSKTNFPSVIITTKYVLKFYLILAFSSNYGLATELAISQHLLSSFSSAPYFARFGFRLKEKIKDKA